MTKEREALKLALEALKAMMQEFRGYDLPYGSKAYVLAKDACLFAEEALSSPNGEAQPEQDIPKIGCVNHDCDKCKEHPEQRNTSEHLKERSSDEPVAMYEDWYNTNSCEYCGIVGGHTKTCRNYTTPPQPENEVRGNLSRDSSATPLKPLTDEQRNWIVATCPTPRHIIDTVEKMHGIKE